MSSAEETREPRRRRSRWLLLLALLLLLITLCCLCTLATQGYLEPSVGEGEVDISLQAQEEADYSPDPVTLRLPTVRLDILREILLDRSDSFENLSARMATVTAELQQPIPTVTPQPTATGPGGQPATSSPTATATQSATPSATPSLPPTASPTASASATPTLPLLPSATSTPTSAPPAASSTPSLTPTASFTATLTSSPTATPTATSTMTASPTFTLAPSATATFTQTPTATFTLTASPTATYTPSATATSTPTFTLTPTATFTQTPTATFTLTASPTATYTPSATATSTPTFTLTPTTTFTLTPTATFTATASPTVTITPSSTATATASPTVTITPSSTATATPTTGPTATPSCSLPLGVDGTMPDGFVVDGVPADESTGWPISSAALQVIYNQPMKYGGGGGSVDDTSDYDLERASDSSNVGLISASYDPVTYTVTLTVDTADPDWVAGAWYNLIVRGSVENACGDRQNNDVVIHFQTAFTPTATPTSSPTATATPTFTLTPTATFTPTATATPTASNTPTITATFTPTGTPGCSGPILPVDGIMPDGFVIDTIPADDSTGVPLTTSTIIVRYNQPMKSGGTGSGRVDEINEYEIIRVSDTKKVTILSATYDSGTYRVTLTIDTADVDWTANTEYDIRIKASVRNICETAQSADVYTRFRTAAATATPTPTASLTPTPTATFTPTQTPTPTPTNTPGSGDANLRLTKADSADPATAGNNLTYTLTVTNLGPADASDFTLVDSLPNEVTFVSATGGCAYAAVPHQVTCTYTSTLDAFSSRIYMITVNIKSSALGLITNDAVVSSSTPDNDPGNNKVTELTLVIVPTPTLSGSSMMMGPTETPSASPTPAASWTPTQTPTLALTATPTVSPTPTAAASGTATGTATATPPASPTPTVTLALSATSTPASPTPTAPAATPTHTATPAGGATPMPTAAPTPSASLGGGHSAAVSLPPHFVGLALAGALRATARFIRRRRGG